MKTYPRILILLLVFSGFFVRSTAQTGKRTFLYDYFGETVRIDADAALLIDLPGSLKGGIIKEFIKQLYSSNYQPVIDVLKEIKQQKQLDDWLYYQLIRKTAAQFSPKAENYYRYTLYKWFLLVNSGYEATIRISKDKMLFYVKNTETIYNIPAYSKNATRYVCLNYHDYGNNIDFNNETFQEVILPTPGDQAFSYKITHLPDFQSSEYQEKDIQFNYYQTDYHFKIKLNPQIKTIFANYPVVDYESYFNIPLSHKTYQSLMPLLKKNIEGMNTRRGLDYLMRFTRYAFLFKTDTENFGSEKRLSPEQTLLYDESDCEDRAALFFFLVKELYDLPMIVLAYPAHVTVAVKFEQKAHANAILHNGDRYYVCEPTPQRKDLRIGQLMPELRSAPYEIAYEYNPRKEK